MSKDLAQLIAVLKTIKAELPSILGSTAESMAATGKALAMLTIEREAILGKYSGKTIPAFLLQGKELNQGGSSFLAKRIKAKNPQNRVTNWAEFRAAQGLQTDHVDLTYSGEMWRGLLPQPYKFDGDIVSSALAHNNKDGQDKLNWNRKRYGNFIMKALNTGDNPKIIREVLDEEIKRFLNKHLK